MSMACVCLIAGISKQMWERTMRPEEKKKFLEGE